MIHTLRIRFEANNNACRRRGFAGPIPAARADTDTNADDAVKLEG
jgi:hypothetical protein